MGIRALLRRIIGKSEESAAVENGMRDMQYAVDYLALEVSRLRSIVRYLSADVINDLPITYRTRESFDYQWRESPDGDWMDTRPELKQREPGLVVEYTRLPREWFTGRKVLDAGCGSGRFARRTMNASSHYVIARRSGSYQRPAD